MSRTRIALAVLGVIVTLAAIIAAVPSARQGFVNGWNSHYHVK